MKIDILTLFPNMFSGPFDESIIKRATDRGLVEIKVNQLRDWAKDKHKIVDDRPFGGGVGMILKVDIINKAINSLKDKNLNSKVILLDAGGKKFTHKDAVKLSKLKHLVLIAGHYEGVDYRVHEKIADEVYSIGDYVLTGGEIPAMVLTDAIVRQIPGVLEKPDAIKFESFSSYNLHPTSYPLLEAPQYTRPEKYLSWKVPKVLTSGHHGEIEKWRKDKSFEITKKIRPDLIKKVD
jgi:tRNA (guanine37-N1)-methyltransferase